MDFFVYVLIVMMVIGACLVVYGAFFGNKKEGSAEEVDELVTLAQKLNSLESTVFEADEAANILDDMTKSVFKEFDSKYQEMLFLYNLIDEKQKKLVGAGQKVDVVAGISSKPLEKGTIALQNQKITINPKYANVLELNDKGKSIEEIARQLNMGKGQVALILNLGGAKNDA